jgi:hypothetical protein
MIPVKSYLRRPVAVEAVRLTRDNLNEAAAWAREALALNGDWDLVSAEIFHATPEPGVDFHSPDHILVAYGHDSESWGETQNETSAWVGDWLVHEPHQHWVSVWTHEEFTKAHIVRKEAG